MRHAIARSADWTNNVRFDAVSTRDFVVLRVLMGKRSCLSMLAGLSLRLLGYLHCINHGWRQLAVMAMRQPICATAPIDGTATRPRSRRLLAERLVRSS